MTMTKKSDTNDDHHGGGRAEPLNMHTDATPGATPQAQPLNMHTDVVVAKDGSSVTITGRTDQLGVVSVRLPAGVAGALKHKVRPAPVLVTEAAHAGAGVAQAVYVFGARAKVTGDSSSTVPISGPAKVGGSLRSVVLTIAEHALTALRTQRDAL